MAGQHSNKIEVANSYWNNNGRYNKESDKLAESVPVYGSANNKWVELYRCGVRIYYDCYNNGGCNLDNLRDELDYLSGHARQLIALLQNKGSWGFLSDLYDKADREEMYLDDGWNEVALEDIMDAVISLATKKLEAEPIPA